MRPPPRRTVGILISLAVAFLASQAFGQFASLHDFDRPADGSTPKGAVALSGTTVFGTAEKGGEHDLGTIWSYDVVSNEFALLHDFKSASDGEAPTGRIALLGDTVLGTAGYGGENGDGTIWSLDASTNEFASLHHFNSETNGRRPAGVAVAGETLYGTTVIGPDGSRGSIWALDLVSNEFETIFEFDEAGDGAAPWASITYSDGALFGVAAYGGAYGGGTIWSIDVDGGEFTKLHDFHPANNGYRPYGIVTEGAKTFGATQSGGEYENGTIWSFDASNDRFVTLHDFGDLPDGSRPYGDLAVIGATVLGTTQVGGANDLGAIWSLATGTNQLTYVHSFAGADGRLPWGGAVADGTTIYGTALGGGAHGAGTLWSLVVPEPRASSLAAACVILTLCRAFRRHQP